MVSPPGSRAAAEYGLQSATPSHANLQPRLRQLIDDAAGVQSALGLAVDAADNGQIAYAMARTEAHERVLMNRMPVMGGMDTAGAPQALSGGVAVPIVARKQTPSTKNAQPAPKPT
jgi:DNA-binding response OmpR family regulator